MTLPAWANAQTLYVVSSMCVAVLIWIESAALKKNAGKMPQSVFIHICSLLDTAWFFVSLAVAYFIDLTPLAMALPTAYAIYTIFGWGYGTALIKKEGWPDSPEDLVFPERYLAYNQSFALIFFILCIFVLFMPNWHW